MITYEMAVARAFLKVILRRRRTLQRKHGVYKFRDLMVATLAHRRLRVRAGLTP